MTVGLTYDLRSAYLKEGYSEEETAEFDRDDTIDSIENTLQELGYKTSRIGHVRQLANRLAKGDRWDIVFNIAEGMYGIAREAQVPALLDAYNIPCVFSDALILALSLHKGMCKHVIRDCGIPTPEFKVVNVPSDIDKINLPMPLFAKPVAEGTGKGVDGNSRVTSMKELKSLCADLLVKYKQPVLVETFLPGREFTIGIVGTGDEAKSVGVLEVVLKGDAEPDAYSYVNKEKCEELVQYILVKGKIATECEKVALDSWRALGCRDGGRVDVRLDDKEVPNFLEVNPLAGLHPLHSDLPILSTLNGIAYKDLIKMIMDSAVRRVK
jgi:D-alanine-D-alanine ligase and related ATP-grasp enzymes